MTAENDRATAQNIIARHGLRAQAIANERIAEARASGSSAELARWESIGAAIAELRRTAPHRAALV